MAVTKRFYYANAKAAAHKMYVVDDWLITKVAKVFRRADSSSAKSENGQLTFILFHRNTTFCY